MNNIPSLATYLDSLRPGENILLEYNKPFLSHIAFYIISKHFLNKEYPIIIDDLLDTLYVYKSQLEFAGIDTKFLESEQVFVIKVGGRKEVGRVVGKIRIHPDFYVHKEDYNRIFTRILESREYFINIVLGFDKRIALTQDVYNKCSLLLNKSRYLGNKKRTAIYFVNSKLLKGSPLALPYLEEISTNVVMIDKKDSSVVIKILKSPLPELNDRVFEFDIKNVEEFVRRYLK